MAIGLYLILSVGALVKSDGDFPLGHGMELGRHRPSEGHVEERNDVPSPDEFWEKYAKTRSPVVFRGAAKDFPAFHLWTDNYLMQHFGELEVKLEAKREKDKVPIGEKGLGRDTIRNYLNDYKTKDSYIVSQMPDPMTRDVNVLSCLSCGTFSQRVLEANLWLSSGGTSSLLHRDADNAINCLLNGTKDWILINPQHEDNIPIAQGDRGYGGFAVLDVNNVNLIKYSNFGSVPWHYANITPGDCLFLPYGYWHQVRSYGSKNMAVSVLFSRLKEFDSTGCDKTNYSPLPLIGAKMVWTYSGHGPQTLGNSDPFELRDMFSEVVQETKTRHETFDSSKIFDLLTEGYILEEDEEEREKTAEMMYQALYNFTNGEITEKSINNLTVEQLKLLVMYIDGDPANTEHYEHAIFSPEEVREMIQKAINNGNGHLTPNTLIQHYMDLGGSEKIGHQLFLQMDLNSDGVVNQTEVIKIMDEVLTMFDKKMKADLSFDYYMNELEEDRKIMEKTSKEHEEL